MWHFLDLLMVQSFRSSPPSHLPCLCLPFLFGTHHLTIVSSQGFFVLAAVVDFRITCDLSVPCRLFLLLVTLLCFGAVHNLDDHALHLRHIFLIIVRVMAFGVVHGLFI